MSQDSLVFELNEYKNKFKVIQALWNPIIDVIALANQSGEICLKRFYWKTGWQKKVSSELLFYNKDEKECRDIGNFSTMSWSPDGSILAVAFESGICHLLDVNDGLVLYSMKIRNQPLLIKWFQLGELGKELNEERRKQLFTCEGTFNAQDCENLRTKDSDQQRDNYKFVLGIQTFCHSKVNCSLMDSVMVVANMNDDYMFGFDVYMSGMFLIRSIIFDYSFLPPVCDMYRLKIQDICLLPNQNLQFAISAPLKDDNVSGRSEFDLDAGFTQTNNDSTNPESTYLVEYDPHFGNKNIMIPTALLAARSCHVFHLMTNLRENFQRASADWDVLSGQFHNNIFGTLFAKYEEESRGTVSDFALDFMAYILTGNYTEAFSQAFFNEIKLKEWKPAREFVVKHIPSFIQTINRHLLPTVDILYVHLNSLKGELERFERNTNYQNSSKRLPMVIREFKPSTLIEHIGRGIQAVCHLSNRLKHLTMVSSKNWAELKYVLLLLSSHPDNEQLKIDVEDEYDGIPKKMDFEILLGFVTEALVDSAKKREFGSWINFLHHWRERLNNANPEEDENRVMICNQNWLKHRSFDKIGPLLGTCPDLPKPFATQEDRVDCSQVVTINDAINLCFQTLEKLHLFGIHDLNINAEKPTFSSAHCLEFCHPHSITKLRLFNWQEVEKRNRFQALEEQKRNLEELCKLKQQMAISEGQSLLLVQRASSSTLQTYLTVKSHGQPPNSSNLNACSPDKILKLGVFGHCDQLPEFDKEALNAEGIEALYKHGRFKVLSADLYGTGLLHLVVTFCNSKATTEYGFHVMRVDICGGLQGIDENILALSNDLLLLSSPSSSYAVIFEKNYEMVKWFELENRGKKSRRRLSAVESETRILMVHSVQQIDIPGRSTRLALNRKRKLNAQQQGDENAAPSRTNSEAMEIEMHQNDDNSLIEHELDEEEEGDEPTAEQLRNGYIVVEMDDPVTPIRLPSPLCFNPNSPILQIHEYGNFTPPTELVRGSPITPGALDMVYYGSPATSTASSPDRILRNEDDEDGQSRTEDREDFGERTDVAGDEEDRTEHDVEIVDSLENSRDGEILDNRQNVPNANREEEMLPIQEMGNVEEET